jgi:hypothetical protein
MQQNVYPALSEYERYRIALENNDTLNWNGFSRLLLRPDISFQRSASALASESGPLRGYVYNINNSTWMSGGIPTFFALTIFLLRRLVGLVRGGMIPV